MKFTESEILELLDTAFNGIPNKYYPQGKDGDIKYNFFLDLEHGYCNTAGNRIHLYADPTRWAIVFEKSGYNNRSLAAEIELDYVGNCIKYITDEFPERSYISNCSYIILISSEEFEEIRNKDGDDMETFELVSPFATNVLIRNKRVNFDNDPQKIEQAGIKVRDFDNPKRLLGYEDLIRYFNETTPDAISATEEEIKENIPGDLPKIMTINEFHFISSYDKTNPPSLQETYQLIAKILVTGDVSFWKPSLKPNNQWTNWESGNL